MHGETVKDTTCV